MNTTHPPRKPRAIVVGVDGSEPSITALKLAAQLTPLIGDIIRAVTAWQHPAALGFFTPVDWNPAEQANLALDQALSAAFQDEPPCRIERRVLHGSPAQVLIDESRHASMLVVGSRGHGGFAGLLLGSVSSAVAERSKCPVVIAHSALQLPDSESSAAQPTGVSA
ncbi:universal stress protein [Arthrobacter subterraneus]|uniref:universal stress protein n=1 Tax=Arthrobacter subterraneus TaxID=335973 RepID=UPI003815638F